MSIIDNGEPRGQATSMRRPDEPPMPGIEWCPDCDTPGFYKSVTYGSECEGLAVRWIGRELLFASTRYGYDYPFAIFGYVHEGYAEMRWKDKVWELAPGTAFWIREYQDGFRVRKPGFVPIHDIVMVYGTETPELFARIGSPAGAIRVRRPQLIASVFGELANEIRYATPWLEQNAVTLVRLLSTRLAVEVAEAREQYSQARATFDRCRHYILSNYVRIQRLSDISQACDVSPEHMCRLFDQFGEIPPYQLVIRERLAKSARLLETTDQPIRDIAAATGFNDQARFSRLFSKQYGVPPSVYGHRRV